jgi:hypothetical protein
MATQAEHATPVDLVEPLELILLIRLRKFLWLFSGLFSAASFAIPMIDVVAFGSAEGIGTSFLAAIVSGCLFGLASLLHFGPESA